MTLSNLRALARAMIPSAKVQVIPNATLDIILNEAVKDIASYTLCLKSNAKFDVVASQEEYDLSLVVEDFLTPDKPGLWWYNGTIWRKVYPRTLKYLDEFKPNWRDLSDGSPLDYSIDANILTISPPPETAVTEGFWLYYAKTPTDMTNDDHYPFSGSTTEYAHLSIFDFSIILFAKMKIEPMLSKVSDANLSLAEYKREREEKMQMLYRRKDIVAGSDIRMRGPEIC